jgi:hypothetical protein
MSRGRRIECIGEQSVSLAREWSERGDVSRQDGKPHSQGR